jgi:hypothetical protein
MVSLALVASPRRAPCLAPQLRWSFFTSCPHPYPLQVARFVRFYKLAVIARRRGGVVATARADTPALLSPVSCLYRAKGRSAPTPRYSCLASRPPTPQSPKIPATAGCSLPSPLTVNVSPLSKAPTEPFAQNPKSEPNWRH